MFLGTCFLFIGHRISGVVPRPSLGTRYKKLKVLRCLVWIFDACSGGRCVWTHSGFPKVSFGARAQKSRHVCGRMLVKGGVTCIGVSYLVLVFQTRDPFLLKKNSPRTSRGNRKIVKCTWRPSTADTQSALTLPTPTHLLLLLSRILQPPSITQSFHLISPFAARSSSAFLRHTRRSQSEVAGFNLQHPTDEVHGRKRVAAFPGSILVHPLGHEGAGDRLLRFCNVGMSKVNVEKQTSLCERPPQQSNVRGVGCPYVIRTLWMNAPSFQRECPGSRCPTHNSSVCHLNGGVGLDNSQQHNARSQLKSAQHQQDGERRTSHRSNGH